MSRSDAVVLGEKSRATIRLGIADVPFEVEAPPAVVDALAARFAPFVDVASAAPPVRLSVSARDDFAGTLARVSEAQVTRTGVATLSFAGGATGAFDLLARRGQVDDAPDLGAVEALLRIALSLVLPQQGALLLHGALVPTARGALVLCGDSGVGKSTAARALGGVCDELSVVRAAASGPALALGTPYWQGRPYSAECHTIVCLGRGRAPAVRALHGGAAARMLLAQVARYGSLPSADRDILGALARICAHTPILAADCPEGDAFVPFLVSKLGIS